MWVGKERAETGRGCFEQFWMRRGRTGRTAGSLKSRMAEETCVGC